MFAVGWLALVVAVGAGASQGLVLPKTGRYAGTTAQGEGFKIFFYVAKDGKERRAIGALLFHYSCGGSFVVAHVPYEGGSIKISKKGTFYGTNGSDGVYGAFRGSTASGTLAGRIPGRCKTGSIHWSARRTGS